MTLESEGTQLAIIGTEHTLVTLTNGRTYIFVVDKSAMLNGDTVELRIYTIVKTNGTSRVASLTTLVNAQSVDDQIFYSTPVPANQQFKATLKQTAGTGRSFDWAVLSF